MVVKTKKIYGNNDIDACWPRTLSAPILHHQKKTAPLERIDISFYKEGAVGYFSKLVCVIIVMSLAYAENLRIFGQNLKKIFLRHISERHPRLLATVFLSRTPRSSKHEV